MNRAEDPNLDLEVLKQFVFTMLINKLQKQWDIFVCTMNPSAPPASVFWNIIPATIARQMVHFISLLLYTNQISGDLGGEDPAARENSQLIRAAKKVSENNQRFGKIPKKNRVTDKTII